MRKLWVNISAWYVSIGGVRKLWVIIISEWFASAGSVRTFLFTYDENSNNLFIAVIF